MFHTLKRLLDWAGNYKKRLYIGFVCSFLGTWCTAIPTVLAAWVLGQVIDDMRGVAPISWDIAWLSFAGIVISILLRYFFLTGKLNYRKVSVMKLQQKDA